MNVQSIIGGKSPVVATIAQTATLRQAIDQPAKTKAAGAGS